MKRIPGLGRKRLLVLGVALLLTAGLVWGIAGALAQDTSPSPGAEKIVIRFGWTNDPVSMNPFIGYESSDYELYHLNYDMLTGFRAEDNAPVPELCSELPTEENGGISADGKTWTFKLRENVKWHDGQPFTAADVAFTYNLIIEEELENFADYTNFIDNVEAVDDLTVRFNLSKPKANMFGLWVPILPEHIWAEVPVGELEDKFQNEPPCIGTGPFQIVEFKKGQYTRLVANKDYWRGAPKVDEVIFNTYQNADSMAAELQSGALDAAWNIPEAKFEQLAAEPQLEAIEMQVKGFEELGFNCYDSDNSLGHPVLRDPAFRKALNYAIDKDTIVTQAYGGHGIPATSIVMAGYYPADLDYHWEPPAEVMYTFDLEKCKAELDAAGYTDSDGNGIREYKGKDIELRLWARSESQTSQRAGRLVAEWLKQVGLKIKYTVMDDSAMSDKMYYYDDNDVFRPDFDMFFWSWGGDVDPNFILSVMLTNQIEYWSDCNWSNAEYDQLFLDQQTELDPQKRKEIIWRMQEIAYDESPYIVLVYPQELEAYNTAKWQGWVRTPKDRGGVFYMADNIDTYLFVEPKTAAEEEGGGTNTGLIVGVIVAVVVVVAIIIWLMRRGRGKAVEEV